MATFATCVNHISACCTCCGPLRLLSLWWSTVLWWSSAGGAHGRRVCGIALNVERRWHRRAYTVCVMTSWVFTAMCTPGDDTPHIWLWGDPRLKGVVFLLSRVLKPHLSADVIVFLCRSSRIWNDSWIRTQLDTLLLCVLQVIRDTFCPCAKFRLEVSLFISVFSDLSKFYHFFKKLSSTWHDSDFISTWYSFALNGQSMSYFRCVKCFVVNYGEIYFCFMANQPFEGIASCSSLLNLIQLVALKFLNTYNLCALTELHSVLLSITMSCTWSMFLVCGYVHCPIIDTLIHHAAAKDGFRRTPFLCLLVNADKVKVNNPVGTKTQYRALCLPCVALPLSWSKGSISWDEWHKEITRRENC